MALPPMMQTRRLRLFTVLGLQGVVGAGILAALLIFVELKPCLPATVSLRNGLEALVIGDLARAVDDFIVVAELCPDHMLARRVLARAALQRNELDEAIGQLEAVGPDRLDNSLLLLELAAAYERNSQTEKAQPLWARLADYHLERAGKEALLLARYGDFFYASGQYNHALRFYEHLLHVVQNASTGQIFRTAVLAILAGSPEAMAFLEQLQESELALPIWPLNDYLVLHGIQLYRMEPASLAGEPLIPYPDIQAGGFNMVPGEAVAVIFAAKVETCRLVASVDGSPLPVEMSLGVNGQRLSTAEIDPNDGGWVDLAVHGPVTLHKGLNTIHVWFHDYSTAADKSLRYAGVNQIVLQCDSTG